MGRLGRLQRSPGDKLLRGGEAGREDELLQAFQPDFVIARREIVDGMERLVGVPRHVDVPFAQRAGRGPQREDALFPVGVEDRLLRFADDRAEAHHPSQVLPAVHSAASDLTDRGSSARPAPIIESRVTSAASRSSLKPSVPAGRIGTTR